MLLNFGHTLAHTIEQYYQYERESHGEAVGIGMYQLTKMSEKRGLTAKGCAEKIRKALDIYNLPTSSKLTVSELIKAISLDKKNLNGHLNLVLLKEIGDSYIYPTKIGFFENELNTFMWECCTYSPHKRINFYITTKIKQEMPQINSASPLFLYLLYLYFLYLCF